ncbi:hypothetical protein KFZ70_05435 [Tamlana fucoidanivorans]|uniref:DUF6418 domain-containing protein n=1 Tax=Allotamlana fucoidanivorans TaxID=2583814 RepID=A0A5C4SST0_9FLAO|nr:DUF6418 domain-containing protein [Tamlana fucoidanivorans]TNJ47047.1 hypothetical protein FGF67_00540 [Tamlana fucoidanivorans]
MSVIALAILFYFMKRELGLFLLSLMILIQYIWMFLSITVIETGIYINEQGRYGYFAYGGGVLLLFYITTLIALLYWKKFFRIILKRLKAVKFSLKPLADFDLSVIIILLILSLAYFNLLNSPIPILSDTVTKFNFWEYAKYPSLKPLIGNVMAFVGFGSALIYRKNKKIGLFFLLLYLSYLILLGQKFTGFLISIFGILIALYYTSEVKIKFKLKWVFNRYVLIVFVVLFSLVLYKYTLDNPFEYMGLSPMESVFYRAFGLQGHVFWGVTEQYVFLGKNNTWDISELWKGMHLIMLEFWPWRNEDFISVTSRGVSWTNAYPSILLRIFPLPLALIVNMFLLSFVAIIQELLRKFIESKSIISSIVFFQLLVWTSYAYTMAYFNKLVIPVVLLFIYLAYSYFSAKSHLKNTE